MVAVEGIYINMEFIIKNMTSLTLSKQDNVSYIFFLLFQYKRVIYIQNYTDIVLRDAKVK